MSKLKPEVVTETTLTHGRRTVSIEIWRVTPTFARQELDNANLGNRKMKQLQVKQIKHDIQSGNWLTLSGECLGYDEKNQLINGQNRLQGIADSGEAVDIVVWRNLPVQAKFVVDQGVQRSGADILGFAGEEGHLSVHATALRIVAAWDAGYLEHSGIKTSRYGPYSKSDMLDTNQKHPGLKESVGWAVKNHRKERCAPIPTPVLAFLHYQTGLIDPEAAEEFWNGYADNEFPNKMGDPRWALWRKVKQVHDTKAHNKVTGIFVFCGFRAWNLWRDGQEVSHLLYVKTTRTALKGGRSQIVEQFFDIQEPH
jgi:hypothetical protein